MQQELPDLQIHWGQVACFYTIQVSCQRALLGSFCSLTFSHFPVPFVPLSAFGGKLCVFLKLDLAPKTYFADLLDCRFSAILHS